MNARPRGQEDSAVEITLNGAKRQIPDGTTVEGLLATLPRPGVFALEADGAIVAPSDYASTVLREGSVVEIVHFTGGG